VEFEIQVNYRLPRFDFTFGSILHSGKTPLYSTEDTSDS